MLRSFSLRLYLGLGIAVLLVLIVGFVAVQSLDSQAEQAVSVNITHQVINKVRDVRYNIMQIRGGRRAFWVTGSPRAMDPFEKGKTLIPLRIDELKQLLQDSPTEVAELMRLDSMITMLMNYWNNAGVVYQGMEAEKIKRIISEEESILERIYTQLEKIIVDENALLAERQKQASVSVNNTKMVLYIGIGVLLIVVLLLINAVIQTLKSRYRAAKKLELNLAETERISKQSQEKNWVLEGMSYINNRIQVIETTQELASRIIGALVQYLEVPAGVIYFVDESGNNLVTAASVAVGANSKKSFRIGEGIVGTAAQAKTVTIIRNIPPDYWKVESALGQVTGNGEVACIPLWANDELKGLIELGCFETFSDLQVSLLKNVTDILAAAINSYQARDRINTLLDELQEQKEELLEQREELHQTNEELSRQAEELQASEEELRTQEEELKQINLELKERNDALENARIALDQKARELENTSRYKSEFLANMSHELRTPLNSVLILAKLLSDNNTKNLNPKQIEYAQIIHKSGNDLLQLINDILDLSKIEAGKVELYIEEVSVQTIAEDIRQLFTVVAADKGVHFKTEIAEGLLPALSTDKQRLEQVIKNLLSNAFKFTPKDGTITLKFYQQGSKQNPNLCIGVIDTGIGISAEKQQLIFEAFQQADGSTSRRYGGTGLGLSISRELVRLLGGHIEVKSEEAKGSAFTIVLPFQHLQPTNSKTQAATATVVQETSPVTTMPIGNIREQTAVEDDRNNLLQGDKLMLIVEDDISFATIIRDFARHKGYKVVVALQGDEGLFYAQRYKPAAIILDVQLPVIDGWTILKQLRADAKLKDTPVHIISAFDDLRFNQADVMAYLKKPIDALTLEKAFNMLSDHIRVGIKKILIVSSVHFAEDDLQRLALAKSYQLAFEQITSPDEVAGRLQQQHYDCLIIHIGGPIQLPQAQQIHEWLEARQIPMVIHLDEDISQADDMQYRKLSGIVIRSAVSANARLIDELELFLHKMEVGERKTESSIPVITDDSILANKRILVVDDDMRNVFALTAMLESNRMEVIAASDGKEALQQLKANPDTNLVLMDIMMPEMDGYEAMQRIRKEMKLVKLPIIALTAKAMAGDREKCIAAGASDYITKPVDMQKLLSLMRVWLSQ